MILSKDEEIECVGRAASGYEGTMLAALNKPEVILMDIELEDKQAGFRATSEILNYMPDIKIVMLTVCETDEMVFRAFELGVTNYLLKNMPAESIIEAVKNAYYDIKTTEDNLLHNFYFFSQLTPTELEVLELLMKDYTRQEI